MTRFRSIISRVVALHMAAIGVTSILMPLALYWLLNEAANSLHRDALRSQASTIASFLRPAPDGRIALEIPPEIEPIYSPDYGLYAYAVLDSEGLCLFSSRRDGMPLAPAKESLTSEWFSDRRWGGMVLNGVSVPRTIADRLYWIQVGQDLAHRDVIIDDIVASFFPRVAWITLPILLLLLLIDVVIFRRALAPVRDASNTATAIGPTNTDIRLPEQAMPAEVAPLVHAVNQALDRLEDGYRAQKEFAADMAHELRTPLAIMRARVDSMDDGAVRRSLTGDIAAMTRTVNQVLDIAELESFVLGGDARADLQAICADAVALMAPLAVDEGKTISLSGVEAPVWVHGHGEALFRAVRNLIENAIRHTPAGGGVEVDVAAEGTVRVLDQGPGVPLTERETIFQRFWPRDREGSGNRGLGLAIVARVVAAHEGQVAVDDRPGGGAVFELRLKKAVLSVQT